MSQANAKKLLDKVSGDEALKARLKSAGGKGFEAFAKGEGLACTVAEFTEAAKILATSKLADKVKSASQDGSVGIGNIGVI
jgi:hypothetical protein